jgi:hypothetical protein
MPTVALLVRGRFVPLDAEAVHIAANAWEIRIPATPAVERLVRRAADPVAWDGAIFALDGRETEPAVGSGIVPGGVKVSVLLDT